MKRNKTNKQDAQCNTLQCSATSPCQPLQAVCGLYDPPYTVGPLTVGRVRVLRHVALPLRLYYSTAPLSAQRNPSQYSEQSCAKAIAITPLPAMDQPLSSVGDSNRRCAALPPQHSADALRCRHSTAQHCGHLLTHSLAAIAARCCALRCGPITGQKARQRGGGGGGGGNHPLVGREQHAAARFRPFAVLLSARCGPARRVWHDATASRPLA